MARTTINSQGVPVGTITASDLSYPLADFSSTGIDDNASSNAITIDSSGNIAMTGALIVGETGTSQTPLLVGNSSATDYTIQQWRTGGTSGQTYIIAYGGSNSTNAGNFAVKNTYSSGEIFFQVGSSVEPLRLTSTGATFAGNIAVSGTVDGRDVATDGIKLDGIEALADVTDATNVTAAGALMDSEVTNLAQVKAFDSSDYATAAQGTTAEAALPKSGGTINGTLIVGESGSNQTPLLVGNSNATNWSILKWQNSIGSGTPYAIAYGGSHSSEAGNFAIKNTYSGGEIFFELASTVQPLRLTSTGATFAGNIAVSGNITATGTVAMAGGSTSANLSFSDNAKALFGNGNDLEILHDGNNSYITDVGTGSLYLRGADILLTTAGGTKYVQGAANVLRLYHTGNEKLRTSSTGVLVTGEVIADTVTTNGSLTAAGSIEANGHLALGASGGTQYISFDGALDLQADSVGTRMVIDSAGRVIIGHTSAMASEYLGVHGATNTSGGGAYPTTAVIHDTRSYNSTAPLAGGGLGFSYNYTTSAYSPAIGAVIQGYKSNTTSGDYSGGLKFFTRQNGSHPTERMRIDSSGNVGYKGKLFSSNDTTALGGLQLYRDHATGSCYLFDSTAAPYSGPLIFGTNNSERMRINSTGEVIHQEGAFFHGETAHDTASITGSSSITTSPGIATSNSTFAGAANECRTWLIVVRVHYNSSVYYHEAVGSCVLSAIFWNNSGTAWHDIVLNHHSGASVPCQIQFDNASGGSVQELRIKTNTGSFAFTGGVYFTGIRLN